MTFVVIFIFVAGLYYWFITERQIKELKNHSSTNNKEPNDNTDVNINDVEIDTNKSTSEDDGIYDQSTRHACFATIVANGVLPVLFESFRQ